MNVTMLEEILSMRRSYGSQGEQFLNTILVEDYAAKPFTNDKGDELAYVIYVPMACGKPSTTLWSCHTDTVHSTKSPEVVWQDIVFDAHSTMLASTKGEVLGADDGAGVWLLLEMIQAGVPGSYIFHRGEERGGIGSSGMAKHHADFLKKHTHAIAFDRRGRGDVITRQAGGTCASDRWATQFSALIGGEYSPCAMGIFTDTANYTKLIPECSNISCGYESEHSASEYLDLEHLFFLRERLIDVFTAPIEMIVDRKVTDVDDWDYGWAGSKYPSTYTNFTRSRDVPPDLYHTDAVDICNMRYAKLVSMVKADPEAAAELLMEFAERIVYDTELTDEQTTQPTATDDFDFHYDSEDHLPHGLS